MNSPDLFLERIHHGITVWIFKFHFPPEIIRIREEKLAPQAVTQKCAVTLASLVPCLGTKALQHPGEGGRTTGHLAAPHAAVAGVRD